MKKYKISIITVTKNSERFLLQNILSVRFQNYKNFEHIIVDGNSSDNTVNIVQNFNDHRIRVISDRKSVV